MHILHVFSTFDPGGPEVRTADLISRLPESYEHSILAMDGRYGCRRHVPEGRVREWLDFEQRGSPFLAWRLGRFLLARSPDLILTYNWGAMDAVIGCRLRGFRAVLHHEEGFGPDEQVRQKLRRILARRLLLRGTRGVIVPSHNLERIAIEVWRVPRHLVVYQPNGVDTSRYAPGDREKARAELGLPSDAVLVGSVGGLRGEKNYRRLIEAIAALEDPRVHVVLAGAGPEEEALVAHARACELGERAHFLGHVEDPVSAYRALDVFALSSATEQMPISVLEAMACGLPVLSTAVGDVLEMVSDGNRPWIVPPAAEEDYVDRLRSLVVDPELRRRLGHSNREHCMCTYPVTKMVEDFRRLYDGAARRAS